MIEMNDTGMSFKHRKVSREKASSIFPPISPAMETISAKFSQTQTGFMDARHQSIPVIEDMQYHELGATGERGIYSTFGVHERIDSRQDVAEAAQTDEDSKGYQSIAEAIQHLRIIDRQNKSELMIKSTEETKQEECS